jgi:hypothetical protein
MRILIFTLLVSILYTGGCLAHKLHKNKKPVQFSATQEQVDELNRRLNRPSDNGPSLYYIDRGSPYDPISVFNISYCANSPNDPGCYASRGFQFGFR